MEDHNVIASSNPVIKETDSGPHKAESQAPCDEANLPHIITAQGIMYHGRMLFGILLMIPVWGFVLRACIFQEYDQNHLISLVLSTPIFGFALWYYTRPIYRKIEYINEKGEVKTRSRFWALIHLLLLLAAISFGAIYLYAEIYR